MEFSVVSVFLVSLVVLVSSQSSDFDTLVKQGLSDDAFNKIFGTNNAEAEAQEADQKAIKVFQKILGVTLDPETVQQIGEQAQRLVSEHKLTSDAVFKGYTETIERSLEEAGILNDDNTSQLADQLINLLEQKAQSLSAGDSYKKTFPKLICVIANFFKSLGLNSQEFANSEQKILVEELKKL